MIYFGNPSSEEIRIGMTAGLLGCITTPAQGNAVPTGALWCADNGLGPGAGKGAAGVGALPDPLWLDWVASRPWPRELCRFVVAPDIVADAPGTLARSAPWLPQVRALGYPVALVAQNGIEALEIPWDTFDALFLGGVAECPLHGPTLDPLRGPKGSQRIYCPKCGSQLFEWKLSETARALSREAKARGKWLHMGRVNSLKRLRIAMSFGCDSVDGTLLSRGPKIHYPALIRWLDLVHREAELTP